MGASSSTERSCYSKRRKVAEPESEEVITGSSRRSIAGSLSDVEDEHRPRVEAVKAISSRRKAEAKRELAEAFSGRNFAISPSSSDSEDEPVKKEAAEVKLEPKIEVDKAGPSKQRAVSNSHMARNETSKKRKVEEIKSEPKSKTIKRGSRGSKVAKKEVMKVGSRQKKALVTEEKEAFLVELTDDRKAAINIAKEMGLFEGNEGCKESPMMSDFKRKVRDIAKDALLEAGFSLELRQRRNREYQDTVYVSPTGHKHWSLPKAWRDFKMKHEKSESKALSGPIISGNDGRRKKRGIVSKATADGQVARRRLSKSELTDIFLEDFRVLKRFVTKRRSSKATDANNELNGLIGKMGKPSSIKLLVGKKWKAKLRNSKVERQQNEKGNKKGLKMLKNGESVLDGTSGEGIKRRRKSKNMKKTSVDNESGKKKERNKRSLMSNIFFAKRKQAKRLVDSDQEDDEKRAPSCEQESYGPTNRKKKAGKFPLHLKKSDSVGKDKNASSETSTRKKRKTLHSPLRQPKSKKHKPWHNKVDTNTSIQVDNPKPRSGCRLEVRQSSSCKGDGGDEDASLSKDRTIFLWLIERGVLSENEKFQYMNLETGSVVKEGFITLKGIVCSCCESLYTLHNFNAHAGCGTQSPGQSLVFKGGKSLLRCEMKAWIIENEMRKMENYVGVSEDDPNDDTCAICGDGGELICCDTCPSTFNASCLGIEDIPDGTWHCPKCCCATCGNREFVVEGEQFEDMPALFCEQCAQRYHVSCSHGLGAHIGSNWFCGDACRKVFVGIKNIIGISHPLDGDFSWSLLSRSEKYKDSLFWEDSEAEIEQHSKLAVALAVMEECFVPIIDPRTNINMISHVIYNFRSEFNRLNYKGFYTAVLERGDEIISVATIRVHGAKLAEMPLIGTRSKYRRQGMCRRLVTAVEKMLRSLGAELLVLPAIAELLETWTNAFGFQPFDPSERFPLCNISMMVFAQTQILKKHLQRDADNDTKDTVILTDGRFTGELELAISREDCQSELMKDEGGSVDETENSLPKPNEISKLSPRKIEENSPFHSMAVEEQKQNNVNSGNLNQCMFDEAKLTKPVQAENMELASDAAVDSLEQNNDNSIHADMGTIILCKGNDLNCHSQRSLTGSGSGGPTSSLVNIEPMGGMLSTPTCRNDHAYNLFAHPVNSGPDGTTCMAP